jgi:Flp pilus assembly pilin Flp
MENGHSAAWMEVNPKVPKIKLHLVREDGQTMAEYAVVLAVVAVGTVAVFTALSGGITAALNNVTAVL